MEYDNTNTIIVFKNDKDGNDKKPDYKGKVNVDGVEKEVALWIGKTKNGNEMLKGKVQEPFKTTKQDMPVHTPEIAEEDDMDSIPF